MNFIRLFAISLGIDRLCDIGMGFGVDLGGGFGATMVDPSSGVPETVEDEGGVVDRAVRKSGIMGLSVLAGLGGGGSFRLLNSTSIATRTSSARILPGYFKGWRYQGPLNALSFG